jgi:hypothetical protein
MLAEKGHFIFGLFLRALISLKYFMKKTLYNNFPFEISSSNINSTIDLGYI